VDLKATAEIASLITVGGFTAYRFTQTGPRPRLKWSDWDPKWGWLGPVALVTVGLVYGGGSALVTPHQSFRLGGALALVGGLALLALIVQYIRRPVLPESIDDQDPATASDALLPPFQLTWHGYDRHDVDAFFAQIWTVNAEQIEAARFPVRMRGYIMRDVDRALDGWAVRQRHDQPSSQSH